MRTWREMRETRSLFAPKATRVVRVLLQGPLRLWKVAELAASAQVSLGWVSAVRQQLLAREWAIEETGGFRVTKPDAVLDAWIKADDWKKRTDVREYSVLQAGDPVQLAEQLQATFETPSLVFTQWFAGWLRHPYTTPTVLTAYVREFPAESLIEEKLLARRVQAEEGCGLCSPKTKAYFSRRRTCAASTSSPMFKFISIYSAPVSAVTNRRPG